MQGVGNLICYDYLSQIRMFLFVSGLLPCSYCRRLSNKHPKHAAGMTHMCVCAAAGSVGDDGDDANPRCAQAPSQLFVLIRCFLAVGAATSSFACKQRKLAGVPKGKIPTPMLLHSRRPRLPNISEVSFEFSFVIFLLIFHVLRGVHGKVSKRMNAVKTEQIKATAGAEVPEQRRKGLGKKFEENLAGPASASKPNKWFKPSCSQIAKKKKEKQARQRAKQARFCAYSDCKVTGTMFESPGYREVSFHSLFI